MLIASKDDATQSRYYGAFFQDDWKVTRKLTLNLGLRYDLDIPRTERYNRMEVFDPNAPSPLAGPTGLPDLRGGPVYVGVNGFSRRQFDPQWTNFGPRFGFAYQVATEHRHSRRLRHLFRGQPARRPMRRSVTRASAPPRTTPEVPTA